MVQPLFFEPDVQFEKVASEVALPEDPNEWPNELLQELFKQIPCISDFEPHVVMDRVDAERGYGFGHIEVQNKTEIQHGADPEALSSAGVHSARIPIVIRDRKLQPFDLLITADSKVIPLTESRLRQAIFRPQAFDITGRGPGDMSMIGQLYPPYRQNYGFGGGGATMNVGMGKEGSVLSAILPTINTGHYNEFYTKLANDRGLREAYCANGPATVSALQLLSAYEPQPVRKLASALLEHIKPSVVQLRKEVEGYTLKTASHACWLPQERKLDRGEALSLLGEKVVLAADMTGSATMTLGEGVSEAENPEEDKAELISQFGIYKVQDEQGRHLIGYAFPNLIDIDGTALPITLFTNGSQMAVQGDIAGINVGGGASLFEGQPKGLGVFYHVLPNGRAQASIPLTMQASIDSPEQGGVTFQAETYDGRQVQVMIQPNLETITPSPDGALLIPDSFCWLPLDKAEQTNLTGDPQTFSKMAHPTRDLAVVEVRCGGSDFSVEGLPVDKLASEERRFLPLDDALFLLSGLGTDLDYAQKKLGEAVAFSRPIQVRVGRYIKTAAMRLKEADETATSKLASVPDLRRDLSKEAAVIPDPVAVDTVLSLGFLNPENLGVFISYLPAIDAAQSKMCELLLASRLGVRELPQVALEAAIRTTEEVIEGLKVIAFQKS